MRIDRSHNKNQRSKIAPGGQSVMELIRQGDISNGVNFQHPQTALKCFGNKFKLN